MEIYVNDIHTDMIKQYKNGRLEIVVYSLIHKVLIIDTTLGSFIPPQIIK